MATHHNQPSVKHNDQFPFHYPRSFQTGVGDVFHRKFWKCCFNQSELESHGCMCGCHFTATLAGLSDEPLQGLELEGLNSPTAMEHDSPSYENSQVTYGYGDRQGVLDFAGYPGAGTPTSGNKRRFGIDSITDSATSSQLPSQWNKLKSGSKEGEAVDSGRTGMVRGGVNRLHTGSQRYHAKMSAAAADLRPGQRLTGSRPLAEVHLMLQRQAEFAGSSAPLLPYQPIEVSACFGKIKYQGTGFSIHSVIEPLKAVKPSAPQRS